MKLYELSNNYIQVLELLEQADEETKGSLQDTLDSIDDAIEIKVENTLKLVKNLEAESKALKEESKRLADRAGAQANKAKNLKEYVKQQLEFAGLDKLKTNLFSASLRENPEKVLVKNEKAIPKVFKVKQPDKIDLNAIKQAIKDGQTVRGAELVREGKSITIR